MCTLSHNVLLLGWTLGNGLKTFLKRILEEENIKFSGHLRMLYTHSCPVTILREHYQNLFSSDVNYTMWKRSL